MDQQNIENKPWYGEKRYPIVDHVIQKIEQQERLNKL